MKYNKICLVMVLISIILSIAGLVIGSINVQVAGLIVILLTVAFIILAESKKIKELHDDITK